MPRRRTRADRILQSEERCAIWSKQPRSTVFRSEGRYKSKGPLAGAFWTLTWALGKVMGCSWRSTTCVLLPFSQSQMFSEVCLPRSTPRQRRFCEPCILKTSLPVYSKIRPPAGAKQCFPPSSGTWLPSGPERSAAPASHLSACANLLAQGQIRHFQSNCSECLREMDDQEFFLLWPKEEDRSEKTTSADIGRHCPTIARHFPTLPDDSQDNCRFCCRARFWKVVVTLPNNSKEIGAR